jgi:sporulation protein YlmC with PRC-barrel domain
MKRSIKQIYGSKLGATDGDIGHVLDFYFDDQDWVIRYVVADTGHWLPGRQVLLTPHSLGSLDSVGQVLRVNLTRKRIAGSPSTDAHKPVSRQFEEEYYRYYGWPYYWQGNALWGMSGFPILELPPERLPGVAGKTGLEHLPSEDAHLRSTKAVTGYRVQATDGTFGHVADFVMDDKNWAISELVIRTGHRLSGREVSIPTARVDRISWEESTVHLDMTREMIEVSPVHQLVAAGGME